MSLIAIKGAIDAVSKVSKSLKDRPKTLNNFLKKNPASLIEKRDF